jgi:glucose-6-phosphate 1-dehydrogenase
LKAPIDADHLFQAEQKLGCETRRVHYLSVPPSAALAAVSLLAEANLVDRSRIIMEKPFGTKIAFREPPKSMFPMGSGVGAQFPDHLTFDLADASKMSLSFYGKRPGPGMRLDKQSLQFAMHDTGMVGDVLEAYERLILDAMRGDHTLFTTAEGIERLWEVSIPLLEAPPPVRLYPPGAWGPKSIHQLVAPHAWRLPFERAWRDPNPAGG